jgi:hypothetical protein
MVWVYGEIEMLWTAVDANTASIDTINNTLTTQSLQIQNLQDDVTSNQEDISVLEYTVISLQTQIYDLQEQITDNDDDISALNSKVDTIESTLESKTQSVTFNVRIQRYGTGDYDFSCDGAVHASGFLLAFSSMQYVYEYAAGSYRVVFLPGIFPTGLGVRIIATGSGNTKDPPGHDDWVFVATSDSGPYYSPTYVGDYLDFKLCRPDGVFSLDSGGYGGYVNVLFSVNYGFPSFV